MSLRIIIPAWNEAGQVDQLFMRLISVAERIGSGWKIYLIDDGSTDSTVREVERYRNLCPVVIIRHDRNLGVSAAFKTGFDTVMKEAEPDDLILTIEANKNADLSLVPRMIELAGEGTDLVLASCYAPGGSVVGDPFIRLMMSRMINVFLQVLFPFQRIHTYTSFYRLWTAGLIGRIRTATDGLYFRREGFVCMADMLLEARKIEGIRVQEVPLVLKSDIRESGSKMKILRTISGYVKLIFSHQFR